MISESIINAVLKVSTLQAKDNLIKMLLFHINDSSDYYDKKAYHLLELLVNDSAFIEPEHINIDYIKGHTNLIMWDYLKYNFKDIKVESVDNIDCTALISCKYIDKINEDREDVTYEDIKVKLNFIDYPELLMLKKS